MVVYFSAPQLLAILTLCGGLIQDAIGWPRMEIRWHIIRKRSQYSDFTVLNRYICPPALCRNNDETSTGGVGYRPRGTGGTPFFQGDIVLDKDMDRYIFKTANEENDDNEGQVQQQIVQRPRRRSKRATMKKRNRMWKNGVVPYEYGKDTSEKAKRAFKMAIEHIMERTCIVFRNKTKRDADYVRFISEPGCWSQIGRTGGVQLVSLGRDCEHLGTAVHELVHALGTWHEQARADRDDYVKILEDNVSSRFKADFEKVSPEVSTTRGYPYDYSSLMHYSKYAFTKNAEPTIKVIGIGRKLRLRIGQRQGLSTIDMAQLRDMYKCNFKWDKNETLCPEGFEKIGVQCYRFYTEPKAQFSQAAKTCQSQKRSTLLTLETKGEQRLLVEYLNKKFPKVNVWRTAGRKINDRMMWYLGPTKAKNITGYSNWAPKQPGSFTSVVLKRYRRSKRFLWYGDWVGSERQKPSYEYPFICERPARRKCVDGNYADGRDYRGTLDHTREGQTCQKWTENYPQNQTLVKLAKQGATMAGGQDKFGLGDHNYCRNPPSLKRNRPWCYTTKTKFEWQYCDVSICTKSIRRFQNSMRQSQEMKDPQKKESGIKRKITPRPPKRNQGTSQTKNPPKRKGDNQKKQGSRGGRKGGNKRKRSNNKRRNRRGNRRIRGNKRQLPSGSRNANRS